MNLCDSPGLMNLKESQGNKEDTARRRARGPLSLGPGGIGVFRGTIRGPSQPNSLGLLCDSLLYRWVQNDSLMSLD